MGTSPAFKKISVIGTSNKHSFVTDPKDSTPVTLKPDIYQS
jgi:hypothetical protein